MARPSKSKHFTIYEDADATDHIPPPEPSNEHGSPDDQQLAKVNEDEDGRLDTTEEDGPEATFVAGEGSYGDTDADDERRESTFTTTTVSSLPESAFETDYERGVMHQPYTPPMIRPSFRRPQSVQRMQMSSPTPSERSLRRVMLSSQRPRTPRSAKSSVKGSPRPRRSEPAEEPREYPLVLLHITILPVELRWSQQSMREVLPPATLDSLQLLRSKVSDVIIQRGILIPHPRENYELLEERLLQALELKKERITKCGHFRSRDSTSSSSSGDSGMGSSIEGLSDGEVCETCSQHVKVSNSVVSTGGRKWSIKVFAANGLMRASAWSAAWSEMERVDVEILPWVGDELKRKLDARREEECAQERRREEDEQARIREAVEEQIRIAHEERFQEEELLRAKTTQFTATPSDSWQETPSSTMQNDLPPVYRPKDIPISLLLKNYAFLLARDRRNIAILLLAVVALWLGLRAAVGPDPNLIADVSILPPICEHIAVEPTGVQLAPTSAPSTDKVSFQIDDAPVPHTVQDAAMPPSPPADAGVEPESGKLNSELKMEASDECPNTASVRHLFA